MNFTQRMQLFQTLKNGLTKTPSTMLQQIRIWSSGRAEPEGAYKSIDNDKAIWTILQYPSFALRLSRTQGLMNVGTKVRIMTLCR